MAKMIKKNIVVIGGGLAGSLICNELVNDFNVTLLELGFKDTFQYPQISFLNKSFGAVKTFCIGGGGTTNLWHNGLIPISPADIHSDEFKEVLSEAKRYTDYAASNLYFCKNSYSTEYDAALSDMLVVAGEIGIFTDGIDCLLYPKKYERLKVNSNVEDFYNVSGIEFVIGNTRTKTVRYSIGTKHYSINSDIVIICAGTLGSPYLVEKVLSAAGHSSEKSGMGLADHPIGFVGKVKVRKSASDPFQKLSILDRGDYICRTAVRIKSECGRYTCCAFFRPALTMQNMLSIYKYKSLLGASKGIDRVKNAFSLKLFHPDILAEIYSHLFGANIPSRIYNILMIFEQKRGNSSVSCDGSNIQVDWRITEEELCVYNSILKKLKEMLLSISEELIIQMPITEEWLWSAAHHSGTIPLGSLPEGLIDKDLKLNRLDNVFVCDGSVIQEHSYANTGLTIGQLAMRLAEKVRCILRNE
jgi:hypothetical protein